MIKRLHWYNILAIIGIIIWVLSIISLIIFMNIISSETTNPGLLVTIAFILIGLIVIGMVMMFIGVIAFMISDEKFNVWSLLISFLVLLPYTLSGDYSIYIKIFIILLSISIILVLLLKKNKKRINK